MEVRVRTECSCRIGDKRERIYNYSSSCELCGGTGMIEEWMDVARVIEEAKYEIGRIAEDEIDRRERENDL